MEKINNNIDNKNKMVKYIKPNKRKLKIFLIASAVVLANFLILFLIVTCINRLNVNVYKNAYFLGIDLSGMSEEKVLETIKLESEKYQESSKVEIYQGDNNIFEIKASDLKLSMNAEKTANKIMAFGRDSNFIADNINIIKALMHPVNVEPEFEYDKAALDDLVKNLDLTLDGRAIDDTYSVDEETKKLIIVIGKKGNTIDYNEVSNNIVSLLKSNTNSSYKLNLIDKAPKKIDVQEIYDSVKRDPKDAYIDNSSNPVKYVNEVVGLDLDVDKLKEELSKEENLVEGKTIEFNLDIKEPKVKLADITSNLYQDKLDGFTTYFNATQKERSNNISIALRYLNGQIIMPGEVFSYNKVVGDTTSAKGYLPAATFKGGTIVQELGGGICQTTSTLYDVALKCNLEIVERHQHNLPVGYVKPSLDATVYGNVLDLKFKNTRNHPIKIVTSYSASGSMNISIYGTKEANDYEIELTSKYLETIPFTTKYEYDSSIAAGSQSVVNKGVNGYKSESYITKKLNGQIVSTSLLSQDTYKAQQQVIKVGANGGMGGSNQVNIY